VDFFIVYQQIIGCADLSDDKIYAKRQKIREALHVTSKPPCDAVNIVFGDIKVEVIEAK
jgi:hypothetical protein